MTDVPCPHILLVDDDENLLSAVRRELRPVRRPLLLASNAEQAAALIAEREVGVVVCEPRDADLAAFLISVRKLHPATVRLILTGYPDMTSVMWAVNEAHPFKLLTKPWFGEELLATVRLAFEQYAVNRKRDRLIDEYASIRSNAERAHAFHVLDALMNSVHPGINAEAVKGLPVGALLVKDGTMAVVNAAAQRFFSALGLPALAAGSSVAGLPPIVAGLVGVASEAPRRERRSWRIPGNGRIDYFALEVDTGTLIAFAPLLEPGHPLS